MTADAATRTRDTGEVSPARPRSRAYSIVIGLAGVAVLLQGVWAGLFVHEGEDYTKSWVQVHSRGADVAIGLAVIATIIALIRIRSRTDIVVGSIVFVLLLILESYLGGEIGNSSWLTVIHFPLAMALLGLAVWLPFRSARP